MMTRLNIHCRRDEYLAESFVLSAQGHTFRISRLPNRKRLASGNSPSLPLSFSLSLSFFASDVFLFGREAKDDPLDPRESSRLAKTRKSARERPASSLLSRWLLLGEKPLAGFGMERRRRRERAQQTTLKVVCGLSRTRALCRSESPRECAPEGERVPPALPSQPPILSRPPSLPAVRGPSPSSLCPLYPVTTTRHVVPPFRPPSRRQLLCLLFTVLRSSLR